MKDQFDNSNTPIAFNKAEAATREVAQGFVQLIAAENAFVAAAENIDVNNLPETIDYAKTEQDLSNFLLKMLNSRGLVSWTDENPGSAPPHDPAP